MRNASNRMIDGMSTSRPVWLVAAALCLWPAVATAGTLDYTDTATGTEALHSENGGYNNTADGYQAIYSNTTGAYNTAVGTWALAGATTASYNTALGAKALFGNTSGAGNTAVGSTALFYNSTGSANTATGNMALFFNMGGSYNSGSGSGALYSNTTGSYNTASGYEVLHGNVTGGYNTGIGSDALYANTTGGYNTASGSLALFENTTGLSNTALGYQALQVNKIGSNNVAVGANALSAIEGSNNTALGINAGRLTTAGSGDIYLGHPGFKGGESQVMRLGHTQTKTFIAGIAGAPLSGATVVIKPSGQLGVVASSARFKKDIEPLADAADKLAQLRPVSFRYKTEPNATHYGLIAEEVDKAMPELVVRDEESRPYSVQYQELIPLLLQQWKAQRAENLRERELIAHQSAQLRHQARELAALRKTVEERQAARHRHSGSHISLK